LNYTINGVFPSLNKVIKASKSHHMAYANMKKDYTALAMMQIGDKKINGKCDWNFTWYMENRRQDPDNITVGQKFILDAFVKKGIIKNDGWNEINSITHKFNVDKDNPRVEITVTNIKD